MGDWGICFQLQTEEKSVNICSANALSNCKSKSDEWMENTRIWHGQGKKVWIMASNLRTFENTSVWKFDTHRTLSCIIFVDCLLKVLSIMWSLNGYHHYASFCDFLEASKETHEVITKTPWDFIEFLWLTFTLYKQVLITMIDIVFSYATFPA